VLDMSSPEPVDTLTPVSPETLRGRSVPAPGEAPLPADDAAALLRRNATDPDRRDRPALKFDDRVWTHGEYVRECRRFANLFLSQPQPTGRGFHVGVLLDNTPDYVFALGGAALAGAAVVGLNHTRRDQHLLRDMKHTHCDLVLSEPRHLPLLAPVASSLPPLLVSHRFEDGDTTQDEPAIGDDLDGTLASVTDDDPGVEPGPDALWALIFTSGTSSAPKAVICRQRRLLVTGNRFCIMMDLDPDDVGYVCMPLFHSNALMVGWAPSIVSGASVGLARRFSASRWLADVRHYDTTYFNYTGKPLAYIVSTPERADDADNPLRIAFGNEGSPEVVDTFARRFGVEVIDAYGATEGGVAVNRDARQRAGALGQVGDNVKIVDEDGIEKPTALFDADGRLLNADECVGEIVNTAGAGPFEGYYNNAEANERTLRFGWYWSGDLGYLDEDRYLYFAGRNADWLRVDGENFPAQPIENAISRHPDVLVAAVYGVPDDQAGDQVMAGLVLRDGAEFDPEQFATWLDAQEAIGPKWRPRYIRIVRDPPTTGTNKIVKRTLVHQKFRHDRSGGDLLYVRGRGDPAYRPFTTDDETALRESYTRSQRERFWDL
jgi:acyl-CoA synthetase (AMP-forming)/AMP-acid ligase II